MKLLLYFFVLVVLFISVNGDLSLELSEVFSNPAGKDKNEGEFIEIYNYGNLSIGLKGIRLKNSRNKSIELSDFYTEIAPNEYLIFYPDFTLKNTNERIMLFYGYDMIDEFRYNLSLENLSWVKIYDEWYAGKKSEGMPNFKSISKYNENNICLNQSIIKSETLLKINNKSKIRGAYISKDLKQKRLGIYFFSLTLVFIIITLILEKWKARK